MILFTLCVSLSIIFGITKMSHINKDVFPHLYTRDISIPQPKYDFDINLNNLPK